MRLKRQRSGTSLYWTILDDSGRYLASLGSLERLGDPPEISRSALLELAQRKGLDPEELAGIRGLIVLDDRPEAGDNGEPATS